MSVKIIMEELEYNILGSKIRVKADVNNNESAAAAVNLVNKEIETLRRQNSKLSDIDTAVLVALNFATKINDAEAEFQDTMSSFKGELGEVLDSLKEQNS